jgi:uncharacterized cupin superfamily protein
VARPILNLSELEYRELSHGERFQARMGAIGAKIGAQKLGYNVTVVPPGKRAFPFHNHRVNEEMFFVLEGEGEVRFGKERYPIKTGDFIACPPGDAEHAHQIINTSSAELRYLAVSTKMNPEIAEYPDSGKFGVLAEFPAKGEAKAQQFRFVGRPDQQIAYYDGEDSG